MSFCRYACMVEKPVTFPTNPEATSVGGCACNVCNVSACWPFLGPTASLSPGKRYLLSFLILFSFFLNIFLM